MEAESVGWRRVRETDFCRHLRGQVAGRGSVTSASSTKEDTDHVMRSDHDEEVHGTCIIASMNNKVPR